MYVYLRSRPCLQAKRDVHGPAEIRLQTQLLALSSLDSDPKMLSLRAFVSERLTAAAEEIFDAVEKTIGLYKEEIFRSKDLEISRLKMELRLLKSGWFEWKLVRLPNCYVFFGVIALGLISWTMCFVSRVQFGQMSGNPAAETRPAAAPSSLSPISSYWAAAPSIIPCGLCFWVAVLRGARGQQRHGPGAAGDLTGQEGAARSP